MQMVSGAGIDHAGSRNGGQRLSKHGLLNFLPGWNRGREFSTGFAWSGASLIPLPELQRILISILLQKYLNQSAVNIARFFYLRFAVLVLHRLAQIFF